MSDRIRVKFATKNRVDPEHFTRLPSDFPWISYDFRPEATDYDWLVVYDDLPAKGGERLTLNEERLCCPRERTILITYEPSSIKYYGSDYARQFGVLLTSQEDTILPHPNRHPMPPVGVWFYGGVDEVERLPSPPEKTGTISLFASGKKMQHSLHAQRFELLADIQKSLGDTLDIFGRGYQYVQHKAEGIDAFRYHVAVENHIAPHHWTEKLSDCFLGYCLPFYAGCPNAADYFPEDSFIPIDIRDSAGALARIREAIAAGEYEQRLPAIIEARRRVLEDWSLPNILGRHIMREQELRPTLTTTGRDSILSRHRMMRSGPGTMLRYAWGKASTRHRNRRRWSQYLVEQ